MNELSYSSVYEFRQTPAEKPVPRFKSVIFDLDGTLLDTLGDLTDSMNAVMRRFGYPEHPLKAYRYFVGEGVRLLAERALPEAERSDEMIDAAVEAMRDEYAQRCSNRTRLYPGIVKLLNALKARGMPMAVLSNKPHDFTVEMVKRHLGRWPFDPIWGALPERPHKPDPSAALQIASRWDWPRSDVLYLGDTATDMQTAVAAGFMPVGVCWGFRERTELLSAGARLLIHKPIDLLTVL